MHSVDARQEIKIQVAVEDNSMHTYEIMRKIISVAIQCATTCDYYYCRDHPHWLTAGTGGSMVELDVHTGVGTTLIG